MGKETRRKPNNNNNNNSKKAANHNTDVSLCFLSLKLLHSKCHGLLPKEGRNHRQKVNIIYWGKRVVALIVWDCWQINLAWIRRMSVVAGLERRVILYRKASHNMIKSLELFRTKGGSSRWSIGKRYFIECSMMWIRPSMVMIRHCCLFRKEQSCFTLISFTVVKWGVPKRTTIRNLQLFHQIRHTLGNDDAKIPLRLKHGRPSNDG